MPDQNFYAPLIVSTCIGALALLTGCTEPDNRSALLTQQTPISIAYWQKADKLIAGSVDKPELLAVDASLSSYSSFPAPVADGRNRALRLAVDEGRQRLWVAQFNAVHVYELSPAAEPIRLRAAYPAYSRPDRRNCFPDVVLDAYGRAYVSNNTVPAILELDVDAPVGDNAKYHPLLPAVPNFGPSGLSALLRLPGTKLLLAADARGGRLWTVDIETWTISPLTFRGGMSRIDGACGFAFASDAEKGKPLRVFVSRGLVGGVALVEINPAVTEVAVLTYEYTHRYAVFSMVRHSNTVFFIGGPSDSLPLTLVALQGDTAAKQTALNRARPPAQ